MQVDGMIQNMSSDQIELDKIKIFGTSKELDSFLRPGEERKYRLFDGNRSNSNYNNTCELYYIDKSGDYFSALHNITFKRLQDNTYEVDDIRFGYIKDI